VIVQGLSDSYTATATYRQPVVSAIPLSSISNESEPHPAVVPASESPSADPPPQQQRDESAEDENEDHYYSEIRSESGLPPRPPPSTTSTPLSPAGPVAMTSSSHVTEPVRTLSKQTTHDAEYSSLDAETMTARDVTSQPSVYQSLGDQPQPVVVLASANSDD